LITVKNLRNDVRRHPWDVRVDRQSVLGNPYYMASSKDPAEDSVERDRVCNLYQEAFDQFVRVGQKKIVAELDRLYALYCEYGKLNLFCWCAPKRCHAETIKKYLEDRYAAEHN
jgi:hypothetical protein